LPSACSTDGRDPEFSCNVGSSFGLVKCSP
jgi:hypothetical protein